MDSHAPEAHLHDAIRAACLTLLPGWTGTPDSCLAISLVGGGISNVLFKVTADAIVSPRAVVFRIYGDNTQVGVCEKGGCWLWWLSSDQMCALWLYNKDCIPLSHTLPLSSPF